MSLNDEIVGKVMGELNTLTNRIDDQAKQIIRSSGVVKQAADLIKQNSDAAVIAAKDRTYQVQLACAAEFEVRLAGSIAKTLNDVAGSVATKAAMRWVMAGVVVAGALTISAGWVGYSRGQDAGNAEGYAKARDEVAAAAWANTTVGKQAHVLAGGGNMSQLATCSGPNWKIVGDACFPGKGSGIVGWNLR